jgi:hypothetical protein
VHHLFQRAPLDDAPFADAAIPQARWLLWDGLRILAEPERAASLEAPGSNADRLEVLESVPVPRWV